jgi:methylated-DNA-protein-cysteine methyltransferase-like protein
VTEDVFQRVYGVVARIPSGLVVTYGQIARAICLPNGARVVGWALRACPAGLPWHRVVNARGGISTRGGPGELPMQRMLLEDEGVHFGLDGCVDMREHRWDGV